MADYSKKVVYLSYLEQGSRIKGAGFARVESISGKWSVDMHVSGMAELAEKKYDICVRDIKGKEHKAGSMYLCRGRGEWKGGSGKSGLETDNPSEREIEKFIIKISETEVIEGIYQETVKAVTEETAGEKESQSFFGEEIPKEKEKKIQLPEKLGFREGKRENEDKAYGKKACDNKSLRSAEIDSGGRGRANREVLDGQKQEIRMEEMILDDKWKQLCRMYPVIHPYEDEREYISIQPKDFVVMTGDYQHLANNSFLLHGFYNYRHIILGKEAEGDTGENAADRSAADKNSRTAGNRETYGNFYLGVPGVYYEREKMVALMFGFEAFECCGGKAEQGKFGYYLRKVKI